MSRAPVIRAGSRVRIVTPRFASRVGYPKSVEDYLPEVDASGELVKLLAGALKVPVPPPGCEPKFRGAANRVYEKMRHDLAYLLAKKDGFGGPERSIHWSEVPDLAGHECYVERVRTVHTGTYFPPSWSGGGYYDEAEWEPGGLMDEKRHRLALVNVNAWTEFDKVFKPISTMEIPTYHLELVPCDSTD